MNYSIWDKQCGRYLASGMNSKTKRECIEAGIEYMASDPSNTAKDKKELRSMKPKEQERFLGACELTIEAHSKKIDEKTEY